MSITVKLLTSVCLHTQARTQTLVHDWTVSRCPKASDILIYFLCEMPVICNKINLIRIWQHVKYFFSTHVVHLISIT